MAEESKQDDQQQEAATYTKVAIEALLAATIETLKNLEEICETEAKKMDCLKALYSVLDTTDPLPTLLVIQSILQASSSFDTTTPSFLQTSYQQFALTLRSVDTLSQRALDEYLCTKKKYFSSYRKSDVMESISIALEKTLLKLLGRSNLVLKASAIKSSMMMMDDEESVYDVVDENNNSMMNFVETKPIESEYIKEQRRLQKAEARKSYRRTANSSNNSSKVSMTMSSNNNNNIKAEPQIDLTF